MGTLDPQGGAGHPQKSVSLEKLVWKRFQSERSDSKKAAFNATKGIDENHLQTTP